MKVTQASTTQRNALPNPTGMLIFNTTTNTFEKHNGTSWDTFTAGTSIGTSTITITNSGTTTIPVTADLTRAIFIDVQTTSAITRTIVLPNQNFNVYLHIQFKFLSLSQDVTIIITTANNTVVNTITGNPSVAVQSYPKFEYVGNGNNYNSNLYVTPSALGTNLMYAPTQAIAKSLLGLSNAVSSTTLFNSFGKINPNVMPTYVIEDFIQSGAGSTIHMTSSVASGGSLVAETPESQPNWNSGIPNGRFGIASLRIALLTNGRSGLSTNANFRFFSGFTFLCGAEWAVVGGQIDFGLDPTLLAVGFFDSFASNNPSNGVYFRPPRVGETNFLRYVIRIGTSEVLNLATSIPYDSTNRKYIKTQITWNDTTLIFESTDGTNFSQNVVSNVASTYPTLVALNLSFGGLNSRNGMGATLLSRNLNFDKVYYYIKTNYTNF